MTDPPVTVCGLPDDAPPELGRALAELGRAAAEAFGEPVEVIVSDGPCPYCHEKHDEDV